MSDHEPPDDEPDEEQFRLFDVPTGPLVRGGDPYTSHMAAEDLTDLSLNAVRARVLIALLDAPACTDDDIIDRVRSIFGKASPSSVRTRRNELVAAGYIETVGEGTSRFGKAALVWALTDKGDPYVRTNQDDLMKIATKTKKEEAMTRGPREGDKVKRYLEQLWAGGKNPRVNVEAIDAKLAQVEVWLAEPDLNALRRLSLMQQRADLTERRDAVPNTKVEDDFVAVAASYAKRKGIAYATWREVGVPAEVLARAGIARNGNGTVDPGAPSDDLASVLADEGSANE